MTEPATFVDNSLLRVGGFEFDCAFPFAEGTGRLQVMKSRALVEEYIDLFERLRPKQIFELGIRRGGSTALLHALTDPEKLVSIELDDGAPALTDHIARHGLGDVIRAHFGVDQADRTCLEQLVATEFGGRPLDFVIDDASHVYQPTVVSFEVLFPHLRPGGVYVIEDWNGAHVKADAMARFLESGTPEAEAAIARIGGQYFERLVNGPTVDDMPLSRMALELVLMRAHVPSVVASVTVTSGWIAIVRGDHPLGPEPFRYTDWFTDPFVQLTTFTA